MQVRALSFVVAVKLTLHSAKQHFVCSHARDYAYTNTSLRQRHGWYSNMNMTASRHEQPNFNITEA